MFKMGEYVVYGMKGVCRIEDITHLDISGADHEKLYYVLCPVENGSNKIYAPTNQSKIVMRQVISRDEAKQLIDDIPQIKILTVVDDRQREAQYKEALNTCDCRAWISMVKALYIRKEERAAQGKRITALDERYMRAVENGLYGELALSLGITREEMENYIAEQLEAK